MLIQYYDPVGAQLGHQRSVVGGILQFHQFSRIFVNRRQLFFSIHPRNVFLFIFCMDHILEGSDPYHKELVQIGRGNAYKFQPFQKRQCFITALI